MKTIVTGLSLALLLPATACMTDDVEDDAGEIASALELEDGGYDMEDEAPMFGDGLADAELADGVVFDDPMETDLEVAAMREAPDAAVYNTLILWGQMRPDRDVDAPRNWSGRISVNRGAIVVRRTIRFEGPTDRLLPRQDRTAVAFTSATLPHHDGLNLAIIDPTPGAAEPLLVTYELAGGPTFELPMAALVDGLESRVVDERGNRITAGAIRRLVDVCDHGRLRGRWHQVAPNRGRFVGGVSNADGDPVGHIRGIYGERRSGDKVFFGKYINRAGQFRGIFRGTYEDGHFQGRWITRAGEVGALGGEYRESIPGPRTGGHFLGRWTELRCDMPLP